MQDQNIKEATETIEFNTQAAEPKLRQESPSLKINEIKSDSDL